MDMNRAQMEALIEGARHRRSVDAGTYLVVGVQNTLRWIESLSKSVREALHAGHKQSAHN